MALKDTWIPQDNTMVADSKIINNIADAVIQNEENIKDLKKNGGGGGVSQEYVDNNFVKKVNDYGLADIVAFTGADDKRNNHIFIDYGNGTSTSAEIPAYTSDLANDSGFTTETYVNLSIQRAIDNSWEAEV